MIIILKVFILIVLAIHTGIGIKKLAYHVKNACSEFWYGKKMKSKSYMEDVKHHVSIGLVYLFGLIFEGIIAMIIITR